MNIPFYRLKPWIFSAILAAVQCMAFHAGASYFIEYASYNTSDEKMGAFLALCFAVFVYIILLIIATPLLIIRSKQLGHKFGTSRDFMLFLPLIVGSVSLLLLFPAFQ